MYYMHLKQTFMVYDFYHQNKLDVGDLMSIVCVVAHNQMENFTVE